MTLERIKEFASEFDPQPMHLDQHAARSGPFGQLVASGWHTLSVTMKLMVESKPFGDAPLVGAGVDKLSFQKPVLPGDELFVRARIVDKKRSINSGRGFISMTVETINSYDSEVVLSQAWTLTLPNESI